MATLPTATTADQEWPKGMTTRYRFFRRVVLLLGRVFLGLRLHGEKLTPERGPLILAANHTRYLDPVFVCMAVPRRVQWMAKKEIFLPGLRKFFDLLGAFPVDRQGGGRSALRAAIKLLSEGWALGIFPEAPIGGPVESGKPRAASRCSRFEGAPACSRSTSEISPPL